MSDSNNPVSLSNQPYTRLGGSSWPGFDRLRNEARWVPDNIGALSAHRRLRGVMVWR